MRWTGECAVRKIAELPLIGQTSFSNGTAIGKNEVILPHALIGIIHNERRYGFGIDLNHFHYGIEATAVRCLDQFNTVNSIINKGFIYCSQC